MTKDTQDGGKTDSGAGNENSGKNKDRKTGPEKGGNKGGKTDSDENKDQETVPRMTARRA